MGAPKSEDLSSVPKVTESKKTDSHKLSFDLCMHAACHSALLSTNKLIHECNLENFKRILNMAKDVRSSHGTILNDIGAQFGVQADSLQGQRAVGLCRPGTSDS